MKYSAKLTIPILLFFTSLIPVIMSSATMTLSVTGAVTHTLSEAEILKLPSITGWGGYWKTKEPYTIVDPQKFKGVNLPIWLEIITGTIDYNVTVYASDGYLWKFSKEEINGGLFTTDENNQSTDIKAIPVIAYEENDSPLSGVDPLRLAFVGENNEKILTISLIWVKYVVRIDIEAASTLTYTFPPPLDTTTEGTTNPEETAGFGLVSLLLGISFISGICTRKGKIRK